MEQWDHGGSIVVKTTVIHHHRMSREDPQFKLRMTPELRAQAEQAAKASGRSLNAELVARLESSFIAENATDRLITAERARELAMMARSAIPDEIRKRAVESIYRAVRLGHSEAIASLSDLNLDGGIPDSELEELMTGVIQELESAGYKIKWDDVTALWIKF
ncbi:Arc family DNA-binding protein [Pseudomonas aeruginosa]|nr:MULTISPECIES: Arc family DNA-binding protein [Pseudomonas]MCC0355819.1 Arc family DNA-binding protein [Pseudomonas aeruginosa]MCC0464997.1 Arc family DNA-binding protein [Pseudomonas aeruginosa]MCQ9740523.1 Arc family DNA-binding protein [Pseudomonas aeruginosa]MCQ9749006.1 Arc family DNA-binding protein [Pseudomonas aeruginosa]MCQ9828546.1 Arc family DNA-binding protein [Pseudomonas aeruginosa]